MNARRRENEVAPPAGGARLDGGGHVGARLFRDWLARREPAVPARLVERMRAALDPLDGTPEDLPSALGSAAVACLRDALAKGDQREAALDLLAADALLTYGGEAAAEVGPAALERFATVYGATRLGALLPDDESEPRPRSAERSGAGRPNPEENGLEPEAPPTPDGGTSKDGAPDGQSPLTRAAAERVVALHLRRLADTAAAVADELAGPIADLAVHVARTFERGGKLLYCGNGGSAADAQHLATEYVVRFRSIRRPLPALALTTDSSLLTAASNDLGFDQVFARQVHALGREGDLLFLHSTSGNSANLLAAARAARDRGVTTAALLAKGGGELKDAVDYAIVLPTDDGAHAQELHLAIGHAICDVVETTLDG